jgi:hypothetical protein
VAAGTSCAPLRLTFNAPLPGIQLGMLSRTPAHDASVNTAMSGRNLFMVTYPPVKSLNR